MAENTQEDVARQDAGKPGGSFGSPLVSLWRDFRECVDAGRVLGACLLCAWLVLLACTRLPYNESNGVDMGGVRLLPLIIYLVALAAAVLVRVLFALPSFKFRAQGRTLFSMLSRLLLTAGCYELLEDRADADVPVRLGVAVGLMAAGFAGMLVSSAGHGPVPLRRCGVSIFTGVLGGTALGLAVLLLPRWIGNMAFVFLPLASGIAGLATSGRGVLGENGRVGYGERAAEGARGGSGVLRSGLVSNDPALARVKHSILRPLLVCGFLFSLALQTLCVDEAYAFAAFGTNEGVLGLVLLLVLFGCCTVVILTNVSGESLSVAFKPVGALFLLCFFLRIAFGAAESALSSALASAAVCCMVTCACVGFTTLGTNTGKTFALMLDSVIALLAGLVAGQLVADVGRFAIDIGNYCDVLFGLGLLVLGSYYWFIGNEDFSLLGDYSNPAKRSAAGERGEGAAAARGNFDDPRGSREGRMRDRVGELALQRGLTPRETQVLALLAHGRSLPYICDELVISLSTAQTHARHIYAKLGVANRQELIDLCEERATADA